MSTVYSVRSSAVRAAKKACGPDQEWVITPVGEGFTFTVLDVEEKQPAPDYSSAAVAARVAEAKAEEKAFNHSNAEGRKAAAVALGKKLAVTEPADRVALADDFAKVTEAEHAAHRAESPMKPFQLAKKIVSECVSRGITSRKEIMAACLAQGIKANTADGAHYELCVRKS